MTENELQSAYFNWMYELVCKPEYTNGLSYRELLSYLHERDFVVLMERDLNRAEDGVNLRYSFGYENDIDSVLIATYLDDRPCSVLEMIIALAIRCEEMMNDPDLGDRTGRWFWEMLESLGLDDMDDYSFDWADAEYVVELFLKREYCRDGQGGLFTIENCKRDLRDVEIWYQMGWHLNELIEKGE